MYDAFSLAFNTIPALAIEVTILSSVVLTGSGKLLMSSFITSLSVTCLLL